MTISGFADLLHIPLPDPATPFSPEGIFHGAAEVTGDASGGVAIVSLTSGKDKQFLYVVDQMSVDSATGEPDDLLIIYRLFMGEPLQSVTAHYRAAGVFNSAHGRRYTIQDLTPPNAIIGHSRRPDDPATTALIQANWETNVNTLTYNLVAQGRYYRRAMMNQPGFYRAVLGRG